jgi:hypothetical protein
MRKAWGEFEMVSKNVIAILFLLKCIALSAKLFLEANIFIREYLTPRHLSHCPHCIHRISAGFYKMNIS